MKPRLLCVLAAAWALATGSLQAGEPLKLDLGDGITMDLVWIEPGEFVMGSDNGSADEAPAHKVSITKGFWMGAYEVTQAQWTKISGSNPSGFPGDSRPVETVSWDDCQKFLKNLTRAVAGQLPKGTRARLPTEAEWGYACRAGTTTTFWFGDDPAQLHKYGNYADASETADLEWRDMEHSDGFAGTAPVGSFPPNPWGLHDMHGNVWEWTADWYGRYLPNHFVDPEGPRDGKRRVIRGGAWGATAGDCRSSNRYRFKPDVNGGNVGLRIVVGPEP